MRNLKEELKGWNYDNGAFEVNGIEVTFDFSDHKYIVSSEEEVIEYNNLDEVVEHLELFA